MSQEVRGRFDGYGGAYVPETLVPALSELEAEMDSAFADPEFVSTLNRWLADFAGRPTPITHARRLSDRSGGAQIWLKREDLLHTGAHKLNNALGQVLLAQRMGKCRIIAETGAGQHGVATATACAALGLGCLVYMGREDMRRQALNVYKMGLLGAEVVPVDSGSATSRTRPTRRFATGWRTSETPTTSSVPPSARIRIRRSCAGCNASSAMRRVCRCSHRWATCRRR